jgi:hypothetical protein
MNYSQIYWGTNPNINHYGHPDANNHTLPMMMSLSLNPSTFVCKLFEDLDATHALLSNKSGT